jgi:archaellum component FlaF (FlaF/FlaG flagellin family)
MVHVPNSVLAALLLAQAQSAAEPFGHGGRRQLVLTNNTPVPIVEIYVSDDGAANWQEDLLGSEFLLPGDSVSVYVNDENGNCRVDVKVVLDNGSTVVNRGFNACPIDGKAIPIR